jgi:hypothetical protein
MRILLNDNQGREEVKEKGGQSRHGLAARVKIGWRFACSTLLELADPVEAHAREARGLP